MSYKLRDVAQYLEAELVSASAGSAPEEILISGIAAPTLADSDQITFVASKKYVDAAQSTSAAAIIVNAQLAESFAGHCRVVVADPYLAYARLSEWFAQPRPEAGIHPSAVVADSVRLGEGVYVGPNAVVLDGAVLGDRVIIGAGCVVGARSKIGADTLLYPKVSLYHAIEIGCNCILHSGAVIGSDGFGFAPSAAGYVKIHQLGTVIIGDNVEIGANVSIDRGALGNTEIRSGVKLDNLVHIAHNCVIDEHSALAAQGGIAGSTYIGKKCTFGGQVGIAGHVKIGDDVHALGQAKLTKSIQKPGIYSSGTGFSDVKTWRKNAARFGQLDDLFRRVLALEKDSKKDD